LAAVRAGGVPGRRRGGGGRAGRPGHRRAGAGGDAPAAGRVAGGRPVIRVAGRILRAPVAARTWREIGYVVTGTVLAVPVFPLALLGIVFSALSLVTVGLPFLVGVLVLARLTVRYFRGPARLFLGWTWPNPPPVRGG